MARYLNRTYIKGRVLGKPRMGGTGALLLRDKPFGSAISNYSSLEDYERNGINGQGLFDQLNKLTVKPLVKKMRNIRF